MLWSPVVVNTKADFPNAKLLVPSVIHAPAPEPTPYPTNTETEPAPKPAPPPAPEQASTRGPSPPGLLQHHRVSQNHHTARHPAPTITIQHSTQQQKSPTSAQQ